MKTNALTTLEEAKAWLRSHFKKGATCPCCGQFVKLYKRSLNSSMAVALLLIHKHYMRNPGDGFIHVPSYLSSCVSTATVRGGDWAKLQYWGLIESDKEKREDGSKRSGYWKITPSGTAFVLGDIRVAKYVYLYNSKPTGMQCHEDVSIYEALGKKFNYQELMRG